MRFSIYKKAVIIATFTFLAFISQNAQDFSQVEIKTIKLTDNMYMLMGAGGNIGVLAGEDGVLMIDSQLELFISPMLIPKGIWHFIFLKSMLFTPGTFIFLMDFLL